jgi:hypothetical protein
MRILVVAMSESIHTARWLKQLVDTGWDLHLFPSQGRELHPDLRNLSVHAPSCIVPLGLSSTVRICRRWPRIVGSLRTIAAQSLIPRLCRHYRRPWNLPAGAARRALMWWCDEPARLARLVRRLRPDMVHSLEIQHAGYLTLAAKRLYPGRFPPWIVTNWGADLHLFARLAAHADPIRQVLAACDYYDCESQRDVALGRALGFRGEVLPVTPNGGGFDLEHCRRLRQPGPTSARRLIMLKGYQGWVYRALVGLRAIEMCADVLQGYRVAVYCAGPDVELAAELASRSTGIPIDLIPRSTHEDMLRLHGQARISIGLSISDGCSTSFLEALMMGSFPIQSSTASADEWVQDGETGFLVPPEDTETIARAIRRALTDDALVDRAADLNARVAAERLDAAKIRATVIAAYERIFARHGSLSGAKSVVQTQGKGTPQNWQAHQPWTKEMVGC